MAALAILSQGTVVTIDDVGGSSATTINGVKSISGIGSGEAPDIDVTTLDSTAREVRAGLQDFGSMTMEFVWNLDDAGQAEMLAKMDAQTPAKLIITLPSSNPSVTLNVWTGTVYIKKMEAALGVDGVVNGTATIRVTGEPAWT